MTRRVTGPGASSRRPFMGRTMGVIRSLYQSHPSQCQPHCCRLMTGPESCQVSTIQNALECWKKNWMHASLYLSSLFSMSLVMHQVRALLDTCCASTVCPAFPRIWCRGGIAPQLWESSSHLIFQKTSLQYLCDFILFF